MFLKDTEQNHALETLKAHAGTVLSEFNAIQDNLLTITNNLDHNKKIIAALEAENNELQSNIDNMTATSNGEIDFSHFDEYSDKINSNIRKIAAIRRVVEKTEINKELIILTDYHNKAEELKHCYIRFFDMYFEVYLNELSEDVIPPFNLLFKIFRNSSKSNESVNVTSALDIREQFLNIVSKKLKDKLTDIPATKLNIEGYHIAFGHSYSATMQRQNRITELTQLAKKEE